LARQGPAPRIYGSAKLSWLKPFYMPLVAMLRVPEILITPFPEILITFP
jgi:hypothetical protein